MDIEGTLRLVDKVGEKLKPFKYDGKLVYEVFGELVETLRFGMKYSREGRNLFLIEDYKNSTEGYGIMMNSFSGSNRICPGCIRFI